MNVSSAPSESASSLKPDEPIWWDAHPPPPCMSTIMGSFEVPSLTASGTCVHQHLASPSGGPLTQYLVTVLGIPGSSLAVHIGLFSPASLAPSLSLSSLLPLPHSYFDFTPSSYQYPSLSLHAQLPLLSTEASFCARARVDDKLTTRARATPRAGTRLRPLRHVVMEPNNLGTNNRCCIRYDRVQPTCVLSLACCQHPCVQHTFLRTTID